MRAPEIALPARFGRYTLLERVGGGGMATVYRASLSGEGGFEKEVAVKVVRPELASESDFVEMFLDEARLSARLGHANLVHTFDFGQVDGTWFLAMEFVRGPTLAHLQRICRTRGIRFGPARSVHVAGEVARGLGYAHRLCDEQGRPLALVHRDVSPQNVLLSREGEVKLADFGIAKAAWRSTVTRPGHVRGKCAYMAPEQARGLALDAGADVFALGVVLWECLTGRPLFDGASDGAVLLQVVQREIPPPSRFAPEVPGFLDDLVLQLLERDPALRPANGDEAARALAECRQRLVRSPAETDLAAFLRELSSGTAVVGAAGQGGAAEPASVEIVSAELEPVSRGWFDPEAATVQPGAVREGPVAGLRPLPPPAPAATAVALRPAGGGQEEAARVGGGTRWRGRAALAGVSLLLVAGGIWWAAGRQGSVAPVAEATTMAPVAAPAPGVAQEPTAAKAPPVVAEEPDEPTEPSAPSVGDPPAPAEAVGTGQDAAPGGGAVERVAPRAPAEAAPVSPALSVAVAERAGGGEEAAVRAAPAPETTRRPAPRKAAAPEPAADAPGPLGRLVLSSWTPAVALVDGAKLAALRTMPAVFDVPAGAHRLEFRVGASGIRCALAVEIPATGQLALRLEEQGVVELARDARIPRRCAED